MQPLVRNEWVAALTQAMADGGITTGLQVAMFLGQAAHESDEFTAMAENLNYKTPDQLCKTFSAFGSVRQARPYLEQPELLANHVYANRLGNGSEASGDGWKFRGRGIFQLTGRSNYHECWAAIASEMNFDTVFPGWLTTPRGAAKSAVWFWNKHGLSALADKWQIREVTDRIRGSVGVDDLAARVALCNDALRAIGTPAVMVAAAKQAPTAAQLNDASLARARGAA
jgi:putative chitinase